MQRERSNRARSKRRRSCPQCHPRRAGAVPQESRTGEFVAGSARRNSTHCSESNEFNCTAGYQPTNDEEFIAIRLKAIAISNKKLLVAPGLTTRNKKLLGARASLLVTKGITISSILACEHCTLRLDRANILRTEMASLGDGFGFSCNGLGI